MRLELGEFDFDAELAAVGEGDDGSDAVAGGEHAGAFAAGPVEDDVAGVFFDGEFAVGGVVAVV